MEAGSGFRVYSCAECFLIFWKIPLTIIIYFGFKVLDTSHWDSREKTWSFTSYLASYLVCQTAVGGDWVLAASDWFSLNLVECQEWGLLMGSFRLQRGHKIQTGLESSHFRRTVCAASTLTGTETRQVKHLLLFFFSIFNWDFNSEQNYLRLLLNPDFLVVSFSTWNIPFKTILSALHEKKCEQKHQHQHLSYTCTVCFDTQIKISQEDTACMG